MVRDAGEVVLEKSCPEHGFFRVALWRGTPDYLEWTGVRPGNDSPRSEEDNCPFECLTCGSHGCNPCSVLLEVTDRCNLSCSFCFADSAGTAQGDPGLPMIAGWYERVVSLGTPCNIQLSGGEPTLRDDLPSIIEMGRDSGFSFIQVNTNGLRLARERGYAHTLKDAGLSTVFLQFDGTDDVIHRALRGRPLLNIKLKAVEQCGKAGLGVVLVPTLVPRINTGNIGEILRMALDLSPVVRGVHFQPVSYFGRLPGPAREMEHITLPEVMRAIEEQTGGMVKVEHLRPAVWEHPRCSFHGNFLILDKGRLLPLTERARDCCGGSASTDAGTRPGRCDGKTVEVMARRWSAPASYDAPRDCCGGDDLDLFLERARSRGFSISGMVFQDVWNLDLERLRECCIHVVSSVGSLVPFCAYNLTAAGGQGLYRAR